MIRSSTPSIARSRFRRPISRAAIRGLALAFTLTVSGQLQAAPLELKTQGNKIVEKSTGERVRLVGVNFSGLEDNYDRSFLNSLDVAVGTWKANVFRLAVSDSYWFHSTIGPGYKAKVDAIIARASQLDAYVILDLHKYQMPTAAHVVFWSDAAERYKNNPAVLFGLFNEPYNTGGWANWRDGSGSAPGMQDLLDAVRATGANNIVLAAGGDWGYDLSGVLPGTDGRPDGYALTDTATGNGVVYDSHVYPWKSYPQSKVVHAAFHYPVLLGEFAHPSGTNFSPHPAFESHETWVPRMMDWANVNNLHWTGWNFSNTAHPAMLVDWSYEPTVHWGEIARSHMQSYSDPSAQRVVGGDVIGVGDRYNFSRGPAAPFSNSYTYYYDVANGWTGLDLGAPTRITQIKYMPRKDNGGLMVGGVFQGSNTADFSGAVTLHSVSTAPNHTFVGNTGVYTVAPVADTGTYRYVRYKGPAGGTSNVAAILFYTGDDSGPGVNDDVIIIDNGGTGSEVVGAWSGAGGSGFHGSQWVSDGNSDHGTKSIRYTPTIMRDGLYEVFAIWSSHPTSREDQVPYVITHAGAASPETVYRNQREDGGSWQSLGVFPFQAGTGGNVYLSNADTDSWIVADAVKFVYQPQVEIIMDKGPTATAGIETFGSWATSNSAGYFGTTPSYHDGNSSSAKSVRFTPNITAPGQYKVQVWWTSHSNRATNTPITVFHAGGSVTHPVNQEVNGGQWNDLPGTYSFVAGSNTATGSVQISNTDANEYVVVDAVRFLRVGN